jgi:hypothetical protein
MKTLGASAAKNCFGELLDLARREPLQIAKKGRSVAIMMPIGEYPIVYYVEWISLHGFHKYFRICSSFFDDNCLFATGAKGVAIAIN